MKSSVDKTFVLSSADVQQIVLHHGLDSLVDELVHRLKSAFEAFDPNRMTIPVRSGFSYDKPYPGLIEWMPLYDQGDNVLLKVVGYHPTNPENFDLPTIISTISAYDARSGHLSALIDGVLPTALRTGASSAVASDLLANDNCKVLGLIGCGAQAVSQLHAISRVRDIERAMIYDTDPKVLHSFMARTEYLGLEIEIQASNVEEIVGLSDLLCTQTSIKPGAGPLFRKSETTAHIHINAVGSDFPGKIEIPAGLLKDSFVCPDFPEQAVIEGECQQLAAEEIGPGIEEISKNPEAFEYLKTKRTVFDSTGWALEDKVIMDLCLEKAFALGLGKEIEIEDSFEDTKNPYAFLKSIPNRIADKSIEELKQHHFAA